MLEGVSLWEIMCVNPSTGTDPFSATWNVTHYPDGRLAGHRHGQADRRAPERKQGQLAKDIQKLKQNMVGYQEKTQRRNRELKDFLYKSYTGITASCGCRSKPNASSRTCSTPTEPNPPSCGHVQFFVEKRGLECTICDHIAGITDRYAIEEYQKLFNPSEKP